MASKFIFEMLARLGNQHILWITQNTQTCQNVQKMCNYLKRQVLKNKPHPSPPHH